MSDERGISTLWKRILVSLIGIPLLLSGMYYGGWLLLLMTLILTVAMTLEMLALWRQAAASPDPMVPLITAVLLPLIFHWFPDRLELVFIMLLTTSVLNSLVELFKRGGDSLRNTAAVYHLTWFLILPFSLLIPLRQHPHGAELLILLFLVAWAIDSGAYFVGTAFGRHKLFPSVSPKKTIEGWLGGTITGLLVILVCRLLMELAAMTLWSAGSVMIVLGPAGDLVESRFKRCVNVKDTSQLLPGHGGFLDRFDTFTLVLPVVYLLTLLQAC